MLAGSHVLAGVVVYRLAEVKPLCIRIPAVLLGGWVSHFMLDSMATYHRLHNDAWMLIFCLIQMTAVWLVWWSEMHQAKHRWDVVLPPAIMSGAWAFLCWDWERIIHRNYIHSASQWLPRYFGDCSANPWTGLWEVLFVVGLAILLWRKSAIT